MYLSLSFSLSLFCLEVPRALIRLKRVSRVVALSICQRRGSWLEKVRT